MASNKSQSVLPIGYQALIEMYDLQILPHFRRSFIGSKYTLEKVIEKGQESHTYPAKYQVKNPQSPIDQIEFAFKYDGINLEVLTALFKKIESTEIENYVRSFPTGKFARKLWYLYEGLTGIRLNLPNVNRGNYVHLLDGDQYYTGREIRSSRHYVIDNLLGNFIYCPTIRRTDNLKKMELLELNKKASEIVAEYDSEVIGRAMRYLYMKETMSSYEIERERPNKERMMRFVHLLQQSEKQKEISKEWLIELQNRTVDPRFAEADYRTEQNYVGEEPVPGSMIVHYICPKPENVVDLMNGWLESVQRILESAINPVIAAAIISFGFVYIHPFIDGNGRLHRFLIHYVLSKMNFVPVGSIFPISATILNHLREYDHTLESFSTPLLSQIDHYQLDSYGRMSVEQDTYSYYRFPDYTNFAEFLFRQVETTIETDFRHELDYIVHYDEAKRKISELIDMPDRDLDLIIKMIRQNQGVLSEKKREKFFGKLTDDEIRDIEEIVKATFI
jgi:Fic family protein